MSNFLKEAGAMLRFSFKTANKKVYIWTGIVGVILGVILGGACLVGTAIRSDMTGEKVAHANCIVSDKETVQQTNGKAVTSTSYKLITSCGNFNSDRALYETINKGDTYNLTSTVGNWANKPTILTAEVVSK